MDGEAWYAGVHGVTKSPFHFHALEKEMATHSSVLAWRIPGAGKSGGLPSMGSHRVRHDWSNLAAAAAAAPVLQVDSLPLSHQGSPRECKSISKYASVPGESLTLPGWNVIKYPASGWFVSLRNYASFCWQIAHSALAVARSALLRESPPCKVHA